MRLYGPTDGWASMHDDVLFTLAMLLATEHGPLAPPLEAQITEWTALEGVRRAAAGALVRANARVAAVDLRLDAATQGFASQLLTDCKQNREHPTFRAFFPTPVNEVVRLGLESQRDAMKHFATVAAELTLSPASAALLPPIHAALGDGARALESREAARLELAAVALRQDAWREAANTARRTVEAALDAHAIRCGLPRNYAADFFPAPTPKKKAEAAAPRRPPAPDEATHPRAALSEVDQILTLPDSIVRGLAEGFVATLPDNVQRIVRARRAGWRLSRVPRDGSDTVTRLLSSRATLATPPSPARSARALTPPSVAAAAPEGGDSAPDGNALARCRRVVPASRRSGVASSWRRVVLASRRAGEDRDALPLAPPRRRREGKRARLGERGREER